MNYASFVAMPLALALLSATAGAQAPTQSQSQGIPTPSQGGTTLAPSSRVRTPKNDGGMNENPPQNATEPDATTNSSQSKQTGQGDLRAPSAQAFVTSATQSGLTEIELSKLAMHQSSRTDVKQFAQLMIRAHSKVDAELKAIASSSGLNTSVELDSQHAGLVKEMKAKTGKDFDNAYIQQMVADHAKAVALFRAESSVTKDQLASFAHKKLPTLQEHKQMADKLAAA